MCPASIAEDHRKKGDPLPAKVPPGPLNPLGEHALYLSKSEYLVHGTNKPASIGLRATAGCIRLYPEDIKRLFENTPVKTSVKIVNQPYLVGQRDGIVYIEVHTPFEESGTTELKKAYAKLRNIEKKSGQALDWKKVKKVVAEARGIPCSHIRDQSWKCKGCYGNYKTQASGQVVWQTGKYRNSKRTSGMFWLLFRVTRLTL